MLSTTHKEDVSLSKEFQKHLYNKTQNNGVIVQGNYLNVLVNGSVMSLSIMFKTILILTIKLLK